MSPPTRRPVSHASRAGGADAPPSRKPPLDVDAGGETAIQRCVREELGRYFELLDGEPPADLYRMVMQQVESSLLDTVLHRCQGNRSRAAVWLGISRGTLRGKLSDPERD